MAGLKEVAKAANVRQEQVKAVMDAIVSEAKKGGSVMVVGFGSFKIQHMPERQHHNPQKPGEKITKPAHDVLKFKQSANLEL